MSKTVLVPLATGFEEIEAITIIDVLRRAGASVCVAGTHETVTGDHGLAVAADLPLEACADRDFDMIVLPGGRMGAENLARDPTLHTLLARHHEAGKPLGAICAAPALVLADKGLLPAGKVACYPSFRELLSEAHRTDARVAASGQLISGSGPGAALEFSLELVKRLFGEEKARDLGRAMLVAG